SFARDACTGPPPRSSGLECYLARISSGQSGHSRRWCSGDRAPHEREDGQQATPRHPEPAGTGEKENPTSGTGATGPGSSGSSARSSKGSEPACAGRRAGTGSTGPAGEESCPTKGQSSTAGTDSAP
ncbi:unnamed protein product, partial [Pylaiella littoralis]